jgi:AbrB family looped-hinge helix DNA binding protein
MLMLGFHHLGAFSILSRTLCGLSTPAISQTTTGMSISSLWDIYEKHTISLLRQLSKELLRVDLAAKVTSKGQITIPKEVRDALGITEGDQIVFRVEQHRALLAKTPNLLDLAGAVEVPAAKRGVAWDEVRRSTRRARAEARR